MIADPTPILRRGVMCVLRQWGLHGHIPDFEDMVQEAYLYWIEHIGPGEENFSQKRQEGFCFYSAKFATFRFLSRRARQWKAEQAALSAANWLDYGPDDPCSLHPDVASELLAVFYNQRGKQGRRGAEAAIRDVAILDMASQGYSDDGIAMELGLQTDTIRRYRNQIRRRLEEILHNGKDTRFSAWSAHKADTTKQEAFHE